jgi:hypothetical protein
MINNLKIKKAAMFGLDARIALAIFGALSVISGAALYSAIKESKIVSVVAELNEVSKAIEEYMLSTGLDIKTDTGSNTDLLFGNLIENSGDSGWSGPYFSKGVLSANKRVITYRDFGNLAIRNIESNVGGTNWSPPNGCTVKPCYYWLQITNYPNPSEIDEKVDGLIDKNTGNVRTVDAYPNSVFFRGPLKLNQP